MVIKSNADSENREGTIYKNKQNSEFMIIKYTNTRNVRIKFLDKYGYEKDVEWGTIQKGNIKNKYFPFVCNVGYMGAGMYVSSLNHKTTPHYSKWINMMNRCYGKHEGNNSVYEECTVCEEWHNFQVFAKWYDENYYEVDNQLMELDKDILHKGNKIYSPLNCVFVPNNINTLFIKCNTHRGEYPIGVHYDKKINKLKTQYMNQITNKRVCVDVFEPYEIEKAFNCYKTYKELHIKEIAEIYKHKIPIILYNALLNYKVEITD